MNMLGITIAKGVPLTAVRVAEFYLGFGTKNKTTTFKIVSLHPSIILPILLQIHFQKPVQNLL